MWRDAQMTVSFAHVKAYGQCDDEALVGYIAPPSVLILAMADHIRSWSLAGFR
jgi:hypothetical protein